jgi:hypothetical protein
LRRAARRDDNHAEIRKGLRAAGYLVLDLGSVGSGCPDLLVAGHGRMVMLEVKDGKKPPSARALTPDETEFHTRWGRHAAVVCSLAEALRIVGPG